MGRRRRELAELEALARRVWGDGYYEQFMRAKKSRWARVQAAVGIGVGVPMLLTALLVSAFATAASAHTSTIRISCPAVEFSYKDFPSTTATSHEVVSIDGVEVAQRVFTFVGPTSSDTIVITVPSGSHTVEATDSWTFDGAAQGNASARRRLSHCASTSTTTAPDTSTSRSSTTETSTSVRTSSTTSTSVPHNTTTSSPETTTTIATSSSTSASSTTTTGVTTTTIHHGSTTSTSSPVHGQGSTTTTHGSTIPPGQTSTLAPPNGNLPFTGSGRGSLVGGLFAFGVGLLAVGLTSLRKVRIENDDE